MQNGGASCQNSYLMAPELQRYKHIIVLDLVFTLYALYMMVFTSEAAASSERKLH